MDTVTYIAQDPGLSLVAVALIVLIVCSAGFSAADLRLARRRRQARATARIEWELHTTSAIEVTR